MPEGNAKNLILSHKFCPIIMVILVPGCEDMSASCGISQRHHEHSIEWICEALQDHIGIIMIMIMIIHYYIIGAFPGWEV